MVERLGASDCEAVHDGPLVQPVGAVTSLAFVAGAVAVLARLPRSPATATYAVTLAATGIGSWAYHGPQGRGAQLAHDGSNALLLAQAVGVPVLRLVRGDTALPQSPSRSARVRAAAAFAAAAGAAYVLGRTGSPLCRPHSRLQPHGLWHVLAAAAFTTWAEALWPRPTAP